MVVYTAGSAAAAVGLFVAAGVLEIGGGWLVWKWRKEGWHWGFFVLGSLALVAYGIVPTLQDQGFGRTYAAYGGAFIVLSLLWGWALDGDRPDRWDAIGAAIALVGVAVIMFVPRHDEEVAAAAAASPAPVPGGGALSPRAAPVPSPANV